MKFGYARVSTKSQELDLQTNALKDAACDEIATEVMTGTNNDRPVRMQLIGRLRRGDVVVVWRLDRWGRSMSDLVEKIELLNARGIEFISLQENIDTTSATGKLIFHIFAAMAEFERNLISERTRAGLQAARLRGSFGGRPAKMKPEQLNAAKKLLSGKDPLTRAEAAKMFGVSRSTLYRELKKES
jgi:DNA invertase Pin-like site-specific DNA recombinase